MDNFKILLPIGSGSYGTVYKAQDKKTNEIVALKQIHKSGYSKKELKVFHDEYKIQSRLKHRNIIRSLTSIETMHEIYVVTEFADTDLSKFVRSTGRLDERKVQHITWDLMSALYYLHSNRILHRDLKPENILLDIDGSRARLCDFGFARRMRVQSYVLTSMKGTPLYMAPELFNDCVYDFKAEFWSIGCVVYEMLVGTSPFQAQTIVELAKKQENADVKIPEDVSDHCVSFLQGLLKKMPDARLSWREISVHPFVKDHILDLMDIPFEANDEQMRERDRQRTELRIKKQLMVTQAKSKYPTRAQDITTDDNTSSMDSIRNHANTDLENIDTDVEDGIKERNNLPLRAGIKPIDVTAVAGIAPLIEPVNIGDYYNTITNNMVVKRFEDNFELIKEEAGAIVDDIDCQNDKDVINSKKIIEIQEVDNVLEKVPCQNGQLTPHSIINQSKSKDLEKRKLNQNLENFSLRLNTNKASNDNKTASDNASIIAASLGNFADPEVKAKKEVEKQMVSAADKLDCSAERKAENENEEWLAFIREIMHEVLEDDYESLKDQTLVTIIVEILRKGSANCKVIESVAELLCLPLILEKASGHIKKIETVYIRTKLVPNLVFASKLICSLKPMKSLSSTTSSFNAACSGKLSVYRPVRDLSSEELKTLSCLYELTCHLVHLNKQFLLQFCDSVDIIASDLLIHFLSSVPTEPIHVRLISSTIALLSCIIRELPENAELVEKIIFNKNINITEFIMNDDDILKTRMCMLLRVIGRFSCVALQNAWTHDFREGLESLLKDESAVIQDNARGVIEELKFFHFYNKSSN